jgi:hypothetical protein
MNYLTNYYKNRCTQLEEQVNRLSNRIRLLSEDVHFPRGDPDVLPGAPAIYPIDNGWETPVWEAPRVNPLRPVSPRPPNLGEDAWERDNPRPNPLNYPNGTADPDYKKDLAEWERAKLNARAQFEKWYRNQRMLNRKYGKGVDREWTLPDWQSGADGGPWG